MAWTKSAMMAGDIPLDSSLGLIFRMNLLWNKVEDHAQKGDFEGWNTLLDRIFCNLLYKNPMEDVLDEEGKVVDIELTQEDLNLFELLNKDYLQAKKKVQRARTRRDMVEAKNDVYESLMKKDVGLRKFMYEIGLYYRKGDKNPARAMWGG